MMEFLQPIVTFLKERFNLSEDRVNEEQVVQEIRRAVEFKGVNVWVLIFAIMLASIGLNVNSTAVIIGAMLISPLMGPIVGIGLGVGISDLELIKKGAKNLAIMVVISVLTSTLYFLVSPLQYAQSELLNRTTPTVYDVFIAFFGGLSGIVATSSRERGNVVPGVAIATALMPPLCTAGYGLATGTLRYFAGAFYLFSINAVFICFSTLLIVRFLRFHEVSFVSHQMRQRVRTAIWVILAVIVIPSTFIARKLVLKSIFEKKVGEFVHQEFRFAETDVIKFESNYDPKSISISLYGSPLDSNTIDNLRQQLATYGLEQVALHIKQNENLLDAEDIRSQVMQTYLEINLDSIRSKDQRIALLTNELMRYRMQSYPADKIALEASSLFPAIDEFSLQAVVNYDNKGIAIDTFQLALVKYNKRPSAQQLETFRNWLKVRIDAEQLEIIVQ
ncbi:MAG: hypothetical protein RLY31_272 [Bacteroidota bacterium]